MSTQKILKATAVAYANIAFIKYWGRINDVLMLPANNSLSMNLSHCTTTTTVEFSASDKQDQIVAEFYKKGKMVLEGEKKTQVVAQLERIRRQAGCHLFARVESRNSFPAGVGIASSASAFAALTVASVSALGLSISQKQLTILTRLSGSGSACRSIPDGFVEWRQGRTSGTSYAVSLFPPRHWDLVDIVAIVSQKEKEVVSRSGHTLVWTSPYFKTRLKELPQRIRQVREALKEKDIGKLGEAIEEEAISLHIVAMTGKPPLFYLNGATIELIKAIRWWRKDGIQAYFTLDAGPTVHIICEAKEQQAVLKRLHSFAGAEEVMVNKPAIGARVAKEHLF